MTTNHNSHLQISKGDIKQEQKPQTLLEKITASIRYFLENAE